jgi:hypothetical protein
MASGAVAIATAKEPAIIRNWNPRRGRKDGSVVFESMGVPLRHHCIYVHLRFTTCLPQGDLFSTNGEKNPGINAFYDHTGNRMCC